MSDAGVPIEKIARLGGAEIMDSLFPRRHSDAYLPTWLLND
jgi:hypothetical protein